MVSPQATITSTEARRKVSGYVLSNISDLMHSTEPSLVRDEQVFWRVPIILSNPPYGHRGHVGEIDVNIETGELLLSDTTIAEIKARAYYLVTSRS